MNKLIKKVLTTGLAIMLLLPAANAIADSYYLASSQVTDIYGNPVSKSSYLSPVKTAPIKFTALAVNWHKIQPKDTIAELYVRFLSNNNWNDWILMEGDIDGKDNSDISEEFPNDLLTTNEATAFQYRVDLKSLKQDVTPVIENLQFTYIKAKEKVSAGPESLVAMIGPVSQNLVAQTVTGNNNSSLKIISRSEWGADESLRLYTGDRPEPKLVTLENDFATKYASELKITKKVAVDSVTGKDLTWPLEYPAKVSKIIIHHTATTKNLDNPKQAIRDIYYWHAISKGWGDIGYNYIIDPQGNIYEGRYGGDGVVAAHAGKANVGSIGIAVLGNYQENDVPAQVINALATLIKAKTSQYGIDPMGTSMFRGENLDNIIGHRDVMSTSCPGEKLYAKIPAIRAQTLGSLKSKIIDRRRITVNMNKDHDYDAGGEIQLLTFNPGAKQAVTVTLKNTGNKSWGADTYLVLSKDENVNKFLVTNGLTTSAVIGHEVKPGETAIFKIDLQSLYQGGFTNFEVFPLFNGKFKIEKYLSIPAQITSPNYNYEYSKLVLAQPYLTKGETTVALLELKNTGNVTWKRNGDNKIMIGTEKPRDHLSTILARPSTRLAQLQENEVLPGQFGHFRIMIKAPYQTGSIKEYYAPVIEGITWLPVKNNYIELFVYDTKYFAKYLQMYDQTPFLPGEVRKVALAFENDGGVIWSNAGSMPITFDITNSQKFALSNIIMDQKQVAPGQVAKVMFDLKTPEKEGAYSFNIMPRLGNNKLLKSPQVVTIIVKKQQLSETGIIKNSNNSNLIRVDLSFHGNPVITSSDPFKVLESDETVAEFTPGEKVTVSYEQQKYHVKSTIKSYILNNPPRFETNGNTKGFGILKIDNYENHPGWKPELNDNEYQGALEVHFYQNELHVVNELAMEDYLKGLAEISATEPVEKIKAVIVLARSYATYYTKIARKFPGAPFDLTDDPQRSQFYLGYGFAKRNPTGTKAVSDTANLVVTYSGKVIKTPYFSSDDGRTRSAQEVWGWTDTPYLVSVDDPGCKGKAMNGHGVGLSGCGALYFANQGKTFDQIIKYYFQGVEIKKI